MSKNVKVVVKLRPRLDKEVKANLREQWTIVGNSLRCPTKSFQFDYIFSSSSTNTDVFIGVIGPMVESCKDGFNATIFTYGEKASGKTHTMDGTDNDPGIKTLAVKHLFKGIQSTNRRQFIIRVGYVEIYNELTYDLLNRRQNVHFDNKSKKMSNREVIVKDGETLLKLLQKGNNAKTPITGIKRSTSHTVFQIIIESQNEENGQFQVSHMNLVDLDRSEGAQIKNEAGSCIDVSMEYFRQAIAALGKGEKFPQYSKSKLTRMLKPTLSGKANIAIICNINPTVLNQTTNTLNFGVEARKAKTSAKCNKVQSSDDVIMKKVLEELTKIALRNPIDSTIREAELAELESIVLMGDDMQQKQHGAIKRKTMEILKIRPLSVDGLSGPDKKYQIGEMCGKCIDSQSRAQRKSMAWKWSDYYLERVGFEINGTMRRILKYGKNLVGRSDVDDDIDICINSLECSRKHCTITVADDESVSLEDFSSNGTTINGVLYQGETENLCEDDVIGIVIKGNYSLSLFVGNFDCTVYRLRKFATETLQTYDLIDDCDLVVISDDDSETDDCSSKMEIDLPPPSVQTSTEEPTLAESVEQNQSVAEMATTSGDLLSDENLNIGSGIVHDAVSFDDLDEIFGSDMADVQTTNLGNLARELDMLANLQKENAKLTQQFEQMKNDYEKDKKKFAEERGVVQLKIITMTEEHSKLTAENKWLQLQLTAATAENSVLLAENVKLRAIQKDLHAHGNEKLI